MNNEFVDFLFLGYNILIDGKYQLKNNKWKIERAIFYFLRFNKLIDRFFSML